MRKILFIAFIFIVAKVQAQYDSVPSPFSIYFGSSVGIGKGSKGVKDEYAGFTALQYDDAVYADYNNRIGLLWNEKFGVSLLFGQLANTNRGKRFQEFATTAYQGYTFLVEYSDMHYGYRYRYLTPQFTYRMGREPFNYTINAGVGIGKLHGSDGIAIYKNDTSNMFIQQRYTTKDSWDVNAALSFEAAYMRQLSQHWFLNAGLYASYTMVSEKYDYGTTVETYGSPFGLTATNHIKNLQHHAAVGIFAYFQWNTKESERAFYE